MCRWKMVGLAALDRTLKIFFFGITMFTSEPSLAQRIERMISDTPVVDPYSQILCDQPGAADLAALMSDRSVTSGLIAAGMPFDDLEPALPSDERVRRSIPYLKSMRNTSAAWCLFRIFRDLYDFDEPHLTAANYRDLFDKVASTAKDPDWVRSVLQDRSNIRAVVTGLENRSVDESRNSDFLSYRLELGHWLRPGFEPLSLEQPKRSGYLEALETILGDRPTTIEHLERLVFDWLDRTVTGRVRFSSALLPVDDRLAPPDESQARLLLNQASREPNSSGAEESRLANLVAWSVLKWHHENQKAFQIAVGTETSSGDRASLAGDRETWTSEMARLCSGFSGARFGLMASSGVLSSEIAVLAGQIPNVHASGEFGSDFFPIAIERNVGLRVQVAPMTKVCGFLSDASCVEWSYGKLQVVRKAMAATLARLVDARFFEEDEIPPLLRHILHDTPRKLYDLSET